MNSYGKARAPPLDYQPLLSRKSPLPFESLV